MMNGTGPRPTAKDLGDQSKRAEKGRPRKKTCITKIRIVVLETIIIPVFKA
jgi:hypothetical protein